MSSIGPDHLQSLIDIAIDEVPMDKIPETPIFLLATAGMRLLPEYQQEDLIQGICTYLKQKTDFLLPDCNAHIQVIPGETEGLYGWIAANYLLGGFDRAAEHDHGKNHHTYGFLDMGGASAQIAFAPNSTEAEKHSDDLKLVRMRHLDGSPVEYKVFTATWLGFGANQARERYIETLLDTYDGNDDDLPDPCLPRGLRITSNGAPLARMSSPGQTANLIGTGQFDECLRKTYPLLGKDAPCEDNPCLLNGQHVPAIDFDVNHFVGVSEFWHSTHGVFGKKDQAYDLETYQRKVHEFCGREWSDIEGNLDKRKKTLEEKAEDARDACFKASWIINVLYDGIGIPRIGLEEDAVSAVNTTSKLLENAKDTGFVDPFLPVDEIEKVELSWTLGKMVLYAAGQISPGGSPLPVGFGSNVASGQPTDFEHAGSIPLLASPGSSGDDDDDDFDDMIKAPSNQASGFLILVLALLLFGYLLRKPERRRKIGGLFSRNRSGSGRRPGRAFPFTGKLFRRNTATYDRILEEGEASEFELGGLDSDDNEYSDSSEGSKAGRSSGLATPQLTVDRPGDARPPFSMDRNGVVLRTESCERLGPQVQMLKGGRRSRAASPTRQKSPLTAPPAP